MVKEIIKDKEILSKVCDDITKGDRQIIRDLVDTLKANSEECVCLAANQIGYTKRLLAYFDNGRIFVMVNPKVVGHSMEAIECEEGCLSLEGVTKVNRYKTIKIKFEDENFKVKTNSYNGFVAECIQHMLDHFEGTLI
jgi:peptide deformylase